MPVALDEFPIHQTPLSLGLVATSDRNFYDRYYFNAHDRTGDVFLITGLGVYPNLGVADAYAVVRRGDRQWALRCSDPMMDDRLRPHVGPYRVEVLEALQRVRLVCDGDEHGLGFDLTWDGSFPAVDEQHHLMPRRPPPHPRRVALRPGGHVERDVARRRRRADRRPDLVARHPGPLVGHPPRRRARTSGPADGRRGLLVALRPLALRRLRRDRDRPGIARRVPDAQRRHPGVARRAPRAAGLAAAWTSATARARASPRPPPWR